MSDPPRTTPGHLLEGRTSTPWTLALPVLGIALVARYIVILCVWFLQPVVEPSPPVVCAGLACFAVEEPASAGVRGLGR